MGSVRAALRAGTYPANMVAPNMLAIAAAIETGSAVVSPNSRLVIQRPESSAQGRPIETPIPTSHKVSRSIIQITPVFEAPRAIRIPISLVLRIAVFAPIPRPSERSAIIRNPGLFRSVRAA